jgi:hypothetical protein
MRQKSLIMLALILSPFFLKAGERPSPTPVIEELARHRYEESRSDSTFRGYSLGEVYLMPSREWIVFAISCNLRRPDRSEVVAVGAYHVSSSLKRQLVFSLPPRESAWAMYE